MKSILCPVDFSETSLAAVEFAVRFAEKLASTIELLHVITGQEIDSVLGELDLEKNYHEKVELIRMKLEKIADSIREENNSLVIHNTLKQGELVSGILDTENEKYIDLIIIGSRGVSDVAEAYFGSNALQVIKNSRCPVLSVPRGAVFSEIKKIVYAYDYEGEDIYALKEVITLAANLKTVVDVLYIGQEGTVADKLHGIKPGDNIASYFESPEINFVVRPNPGSLHEGINNYLGESGASMLAVLKKRRNFIENMFHESLTKYYTYYADIPVLIFKY